MAVGQYKEWITEEGQTLLRGWKRQGLTDEQIAEKIGINVRTIYDWKDKYPQISQALKKGKTVCDFEAEEALMSMFKGHVVEDVWAEEEQLANGQKKKHVKRVKRWVEPNVTAIIFYLKARAGWRDNVPLDNSDEDNDNVKKFIKGLVSSEQSE